MKDKKPFQSKKFIALAVGVSFTTLFTFLSLVMIGLFPNTSSAIVNLMTVSLAAMNSVIGIYALGQSVVDFKINSQHETSQENKKIDYTKRLIDDVKSKEFKYKDLDKLNWDDINEDDIDYLNFKFHNNET